MALLDEFKSFAMRGNVVDLAVGVVIGGAFGKIVTSFVNDVLMPPLGMLLGGVNFSGLALTLKAAEGEAPAVLWKFGSFIQSVVDFTIIAFAIFLVVKAMNTLQRKQAATPPPPAPPPPEVVLLTEIRDSLRSR
jgi:large conductance mechanosensitive channel